jgi:hypothetical protein
MFTHILFSRQEQEQQQQQRQANKKEKEQEQEQKYTQLQQSGYQEEIGLLSISLMVWLKSIEWANSARLCFDKDNGILIRFLHDNND